MMDWFAFFPPYIGAVIASIVWLYTRTETGVGLIPVLAVGAVLGFGAYLYAGSASGATR